MGKYAYVKLSIILYHKQTSLSIGFMKIIKNVFQKLFLFLMPGKGNMRIGLSGEGA